MEKEARLVRKYNKKRRRTEWALVSRTDPSKVLKWFGPRKPSKERVLKEERRVQWFKHKGSVKEAWLTEELPVTPSQDVYPSLKEDVELVKKILHGPKSNIGREDVFGPQVETEFGSGLLKKDKELYPRYEFTETPQFKRGAEGPVQELGLKPWSSQIRKMIEEAEVIEGISKSLYTKVQDIINDIEKIHDILNFEIKGISFRDFLKVLYIANSDLWKLPSSLLDLISKEPDPNVIETLTKISSDLKVLADTIGTSREKWLLIIDKNNILRTISAIDKYIDLIKDPQPDPNKIKQIRDVFYNELKDLLEGTIGKLSIDFYAKRESFKKRLFSKETKDWVENLSNLPEYRKELANKIKNFIEDSESFNASSLRMFFDYFEKGIEKVRERIKNLEGMVEHEVRPFAEPGLLFPYQERSVSPSSIYKSAPEETYGLLTEMYKEVLEAEEVPAALELLRKFLDFLIGAYNRAKSILESFTELEKFLSNVPYILGTPVIDNLSEIGKYLKSQLEKEEGDLDVENIPLSLETVEKTKELSNKLGNLKGVLKNKVSSLIELIDFVKDLKHAFEGGVFSKLARLEETLPDEEVQESLKELLKNTLKSVLFFARKSLISRLTTLNKDYLSDVGNVTSPSEIYELAKLLINDIYTLGEILKEMENYVSSIKEAINPILETVTDKIVSFLEEKLDFEGIILSVISSYEGKPAEISYNLLKSALSGLSEYTQRFIRENYDKLSTSFSLLIDHLPLKYLREFIPETNLKDLFNRAARGLLEPEILEKCLSEIPSISLDDHLTYKEIDSIWYSILSDLRRKKYLDDVSLGELREFLSLLYKGIFDSYMNEALYIYLQRFLEKLPSEGNVSFEKVQNILEETLQEVIPKEVQSIEKVSVLLQEVIQDYLQEMLYKGIENATSHSLIEAIDYKSLIDEVKKYVKDKLAFFIKDYLNFVISKSKNLLKESFNTIETLKKAKETLSDIVKNEKVNEENLNNVKNLLISTYNSIKHLFEKCVIGPFALHLFGTSNPEFFSDEFIKNVPEIVRKKVESFYGKRL